MDNDIHSSTLGAEAGSMTQVALGGRDLHYYNLWKQTGDKQHMGMLLKSLKPLMIKEVHKVSGTLPTAALMASAKRWTIHAVKTYDPTKGAQLSTHVTNWLQKIKRENYKYQNAARIPENLHIEFGKFKEAEESFKERFDRDPTDDELAHELGWSKKQVVNLKSRNYEDRTEGANEAPSVVHKTNEESLFIEHLKQVLSHSQQEMLFNPKEMSVADLAKSLGMTMSKYQYERGKLVKFIEEQKHEFFR